MVSHFTQTDFLQKSSRMFTQMNIRQIWKIFTNFTKIYGVNKIHTQNCGLQQSKVWIFTFNLFFYRALYDFLHRVIEC